MIVCLPHVIHANNPAALRTIFFNLSALRIIVTWNEISKISKIIFIHMAYEYSGITINILIRKFPWFVLHGARNYFLQSHNGKLKKWDSRKCLQRVRILTSCLVSKKVIKMSKNLQSNNGFLRLEHIPRQNYAAWWA